MAIATSFVLTLITIFVVPLLIYSFFVKYAGMKEPEKKLSFFVSVLLQKIGTAFGFVILFAIAHEYLASNWLAYGMIWSAMFAIVEIGQAIGSNYSKKEAVAGIISEFIYFPISAFIIAQLLS